MEVTGRHHRRTPGRLREADQEAAGWGAGSVDKHGFRMKNEDGLPADSIFSVSTKHYVLRF